MRITVLLAKLSDSTYLQSLWALGSIIPIRIRKRHLYLWSKSPLKGRVQQTSGELSVTLGRRTHILASKSTFLLNKNKFINTYNYFGRVFPSFLNEKTRNQSVYFHLWPSAKCIFQLFSVASSKNYSRALWELINSDVAD